MTKLELKHLSPYLPYGLKVSHPLGVFNLNGLRETDMQMALLENESDVLWGYLYEIKPILRPLSDLTQEIEHNGKKIIPSDVLNTDFSDLIALPETYKFGQYNIVSSLIEWHFDVFGLISAGLAVSYKEVGL